MKNNEKIIKVSGNYNYAAARKIGMSYNGIYDVVIVGGENNHRFIINLVDGTITEQVNGLSYHTSYGNSI